MSYGQKALYFLYLSSPESSAYNVSFTARILSRVDVNSLRRAFQHLVNRHSPLRASYKIIDGIPVQEFQGYQEIYFEEIDSKEKSDESLKKFVKSKSDEPFDLENGPVIKVYLFKISDENYVLLISIHHIAVDGFSLTVLLDEVKDFYSSEVQNKKSDLPELTSSFADYVSEQESLISSAKGDDLWTYWKNELSGELTPLDLSFSKPRPPVQTFNGAVENFQLEKDLTDKLKSLSKAEGTTLFVTLLSAYQVFLHRYSGQDEILIGTPTSGRNKSEFEKIVGYFISSAIIKGNLDGNPEFTVFLNQIKKKVLGAISNQDFPFQVIVERLLQKRDASRSPIAQHFFGFQNTSRGNELQEILIPGNDGARAQWGELVLESFYISQQEGQFDFTLEFFEGKNLFTGSFKYNTDLFDAKSVKKMISHFKNLLNEIVSNPQKRISEYKFLSDAEYDLIVNKRNDTDFEFENMRAVHDLFEAQTRLTPDAIAVEFENEALTYSELNRKSNQLAGYLIKQGAEKETLTALCMERSLEMVIAILGVLKAGGAYIPVDPSYPAKRIEYMLKDSNAKILITNKNLSDIFPNEIPASVFYFEDLSEKISNEPDADLNLETGLDNLAYVIYTSGSTGNPKGVMITHRSLSNHMLWMKNVFEFDSSDSVLQKTPFSFDASVWEFFLPLILGGRLVMAKPDGHMDTLYLTEEIQKRNITILQLVPSLLKLLLEEKNFDQCKSLKTVFCGGEALTYDLQEKLLKKLNVNFYNFYGPTEATIDATYFKCKGEGKFQIPIGKPIYNTQAYVLDKYLNPLPDGIAGELLIGGIGIARGYLNNSELTKDKFIEDIFRKGEGKKLYKTGDLAKFSEDGNLEFSGRADHQVKLHGFRIELGEIESKLLEHPEIKEAAVIIREDKPGVQRLTAYISGANINPADAKNFLREKLPEYMIPHVIMVLEKIPVTPNGKVDRQSLPAPEIQLSREADYKEPKIPVEKILADIWKQVLGLEKVSVNDNFFELGGDSIISIQIISKANQAGIKITPRQIFQFQTIAELSSVVNFKAPTTAEQGAVTGNLPLTPIQHWFFAQNLPEPQHYNHIMILNVPKNLNENYLKEAVAEIVKHHDALRLSFNKESSVWKQFNEAAKETNHFSSAVISGADETELKKLIEKNINELQSAINITDGSLIKVRLMKQNVQTEDKLVIVIHHLCVDGISWRIIAEDFLECYNQLSSGEKIKLQPKTNSFKDWSQRLNDYALSGNLSEEKNYWLKFADCKSRLPVDISADIKDNTAGSADTASLELDESNTQLLLKEVPKAYNTRINEVLLTALIYAYNDFCNEDKLMISLEGHGREELFENFDISRTVGWFTSMFPFELALKDKSNTGESLKSIKESLRSLPNNGIGYGLIRYSGVDEISKEKLKTIRTEIVFNYLGQINEEINKNSDWKISGNGIYLSQNENCLRNALVEINSLIIGNKFRVEFVYSKNFHNKETITKFAKHFEDSLKQIISHCTSADAGGYTASDFSDSGLNQQELDSLLANIN